MSGPRRVPGAEAARAKGWLAAHRWLLARRAVQLGFLVLFFAGPTTGLWIVKGTMASSLTLGALPLTDPMIALQALAAGQLLAGSALLGAGLVLAAYLLVGGRVYCAWVCPLNLATDAAHWLRVRLDIKESLALGRRVRLWVLIGAIAASAISGVVAWELFNPVTVVWRGLLFGSLFSAGLVAAGIFLFDLAISRRGWCGHLCPVGAFYALLGNAALLRVSAVRRADCDNCMDCYAVCPEPHVLSPALKGGAKGLGPMIAAGDCTNCGRCMDVCARDVFTFTTRLGGGGKTGSEDDDHKGQAKEAA